MKTIFLKGLCTIVCMLFIISCDNEGSFNVLRVYDATYNYE